MSQVRYNLNITKLARLFLHTIFISSALVMNKAWTELYTCPLPGLYTVCKFIAPPNTEKWKFAGEFRSPCNLFNLPDHLTSILRQFFFDSYFIILDDDKAEVLLQLKLDQTESSLLGTSYNGFIIWDLSDPYGINSSKFLKLPHGIRNISTRVLVSNSFMISASRDYAVAGVR